MNVVKKQTSAPDGIVCREFRSQDPHKHNVVPLIPPRVSVVVPTYRRPDLLDKCLRALGEQDLPKSQYEIIVCDDGPSEAIRSIVDEHRASGMPIRYVPVSATQGPAGARNAGGKLANAPIVAFTDDDTVPSPTWLTTGLAAFDPNVDAIAGRIVMPIPNVPTDYERDANGLERAEFVTANCMVRRDALMAIGGFDERFTMAWREDSDLQFSLLDKGFNIKRVPEALIVHPLRPGKFAVAIGMQKKVMFDTLLYKKHPLRYRQSINRHLPWYYMTITALLCVAVLASLALEWQITLVCLTGWLALTLHFCFRRLRGTRHDLTHVAEMLITSAVIPLLSIFWRLIGSVRFKKGFP